MIRIIQGDVRDILPTLPDESVHCVVTSPPYWGLRDYGTGRWEGGSVDCDHARYLGGHGEASAKQVTSAGTQKYQYTGACPKCGAVRIDRQIGMERTMGEHLQVMVDVFREVRRVLRKDGTCWLNYGDCCATRPNGRSAADVGPIYDPDGGQVPDNKNPKARAGKSDNRGNTGADHGGRIRAGGYLKPKDLCMVSNRLAIALQEDGWWVRSEIVWHKPNPMPESVTDRPSSAHEKVWLLTKSERYWYDAEAVSEPATHAGRVVSYNGTQKTADSENRTYPGTTNRDILVKERRNLRNVWTIATSPFPDAHFATFPCELAELCIKAGCPGGGVVLDPFGGSGTVGLVADRLGRDAILIELNPDYCEMARSRIRNDAPMFAQVSP